MNKLAPVYYIRRSFNWTNQPPQAIATSTTHEKLRRSSWPWTRRRWTVSTPSPMRSNLQIMAWHSSMPSSDLSHPSISFRLVAVMHPSPSISYKLNASRSPRDGELVGVGEDVEVHVCHARCLWALVGSCRRGVDRRKKASRKFHGRLRREGIWRRIARLYICCLGTQAPNQFDQIWWYGASIGR
jgi:hypothetical protein